MFELGDLDIEPGQALAYCVHARLAAKERRLVVDQARDQRADLGEAHPCSQQRSDPAHPFDGIIGVVPVAIVQPDRSHEPHCLVVADRAGARPGRPRQITDLHVPAHLLQVRLDLDTDVSLYGTPGGADRAASGYCTGGVYTTMKHEDEQKRGIDESRIAGALWVAPEAR